MNYYFKVYLKNAAVGAVAGSTFGAACGSGAGVVGLHQMCAANTMHTCEDLADVLLPRAENTAMSMGALTGAAIGALIGVTAYPAYQGIVGWCYPRVSSRREPIVLEESTIGNRL